MQCGGFLDLHGAHLQFARGDGQKPFAPFVRFEINLCGDVRPRAGADEAKSLFVAGPHGRIHGKFQLDRFVELRVETDVADVAVRRVREVGEARGVRRARGAAVGAQNFPAQVQQPGARRVQKQFQNIPAVRAPILCDRERTDVRQFHVRRFREQCGQFCDQRRGHFFGAQFVQAVFERRAVRLGLRQFRHRDALLAGEVFADVPDERAQVAHGFRADDVFDEQRAKKISRLEAAKKFDGAAGFGFAQAHAHHGLDERAGLKNPPHLVKFRLGPLEGKFLPHERQAEDFRAGDDFASAFGQRLDFVFDRRQADGAVEPVRPRQNRPDRRARMRQFDRFFDVDQSRHRP